MASLIKLTWLHSKYIFKENFSGRCIFMMAYVRRVEYVLSQRGGRQIMLEGYRYTLNNSRKTATHWKCATAGCPGKCTTVDDLVRNVTDHTHAPESETAVKFISNLRKRARDEITVLPQLYNE